MVPPLPFLRLITLDLTGTVFRFRRPPFSIYADVSAKHGVHCDEADVQRGFFKAWKKLNSQDANFGAQTDGDSKRWWGQVVEETFKEALGSRYSQPTVGPIVQELYTSYSSPAMYELFPDAIQFLESVQKPRRSGELKVAALTNYDRRVHNIVKHLGLSSKLDFVMCSEDAKSSKPEPGIFLAALERANRDKSQGRIEPREIMHVGDDVGKDYIGARGVGWNALLVDRDNYNHSRVDVDHVCRDFHDVEKKLGLDVAQ